MIVVVALLLVVMCLRHLWESGGGVLGFVHVIHPIC